MEVVVVEVGEYCLIDLRFAWLYFRVLRFLIQIFACLWCLSLVVV